MGDGRDRRRGYSPRTIHTDLQGGSLIECFDEGAIATVPPERYRADGTHVAACSMARHKREWSAEGGTCLSSTNDLAVRDVSGFR